MSYKDYLHAALDAVLTKAVATGQDYRSVIPIPYSDIANERGMKISEEMSALGIEVVIEITLTEKNGTEDEPKKVANKDTTRH